MLLKNCLSSPNDSLKDMVFQTVEPDSRSESLRDDGIRTLGRGSIDKELSDDYLPTMKVFNNQQFVEIHLCL
jgi:hypothetical protein